MNVSYHMMDQSKPKNLDEVLQANPNSLVKDDNGTVTCFVCDHTFSGMKHFSYIAGHVKCSEHLTLLNWNPEIGLTKREYLQMNTYYNNYKQFVEIDRNRLVCTVCDDKSFDSSNFSSVKYHCNKVHAFKAQSSRSPLGDVTNTPKVVFPLGKPGSSSLKQHQFSEDEMSIAMQNEIDRPTNKDKPLRIVNGQLMCVQCNSIFNPQLFSSYYHSVRKHWLSDVHKKSFAANQTQVRYEEWQTEKFECLKKGQPFKGDGKLTPPKVGKVAPHHRQIATSVKVDAAKLMVYGCHPLKTVNTSMKSCLVSLFGRTLSPTSIDDGIDRCLQAAINARRAFLSDKSIYISIDDTTCDHNWAAIEIGVLGPNMERFPIHVKKVEDKKGETFVAAIEEVLYQIWPDGPPVDQIRLLVTDGASPMIKCGKILKSKYPKLYHILCMAHKMHNIADLLKEHCPIVYEFTGLLKQVLARSKKRNDLFMKCTSGVRFPVPHDIRFGSWFRTDNFSEHFLPEIVNFARLLPPERSTKKVENAKSRVNELKDFVEDKHKMALLKEYLEFITEFYGDLPLYIFEIEGSQVLLKKSIEIIKKVQSILKFAVENCKAKHRKIAQEVLDKFEYDMELNSDLWEMEKECEIDPNSVYQYAPVNSCDVERMFARFRLEFCHPKCHLSPEQMTKQYAVKVAFRSDDFEYQLVSNHNQTDQSFVNDPDNIKEEDQDTEYWQFNKPAVKERKYKLELFGKYYVKPKTPSLDELIVITDYRVSSTKPVSAKSTAAKRVLDKSNEPAQSNKRVKVSKPIVAATKVSSNAVQETTLTTRSGRTLKNTRRYLDFN